MKEMKDEDAVEYEKHFRVWIKTLKDAKVKSVEELYKKVHASIKTNPDRTAKKQTKKFTRKVENNVVTCNGKKWLRSKKIGLEKRKENVQTKIQKMVEKIQEKQ